MPIDKSLIAGSTAILVLKLLEEGDLYGYQMIETLALRSDDTFQLKAGTLYPLLHSLEADGAVVSYEQKADSERVRKYYHLTERGKKLLRQKEKEWEQYSSAVNKVLKGGAGYAFA
ncbi:MAG TPA: helix-turn-helix transcriptional regulator [Candidatus Merdivicinus intestinigallinarum]|nr:helix-turn-helix transcriptional regulator [Candidatus Merdivicinus intestinigallinarum]